MKDKRKKREKAKKEKQIDTIKMKSESFKL